MVGGARGHRVDGIGATATRPGPGAHFVSGHGGREDVDAINAALICRDHLLGSLDERSIRILKGLLSNHTKKDIAAAEGISASAVSQRAGRDGLDLIVQASQYLRSVPMSALAVMFIAMGIADVCRRLTRGVWLPVALAPVVVVGCAVLAGLWHLGDIALLVIAAAASIGWLLLCARAERTGEHELAPLALFGAAVGAADCVVRLGF